MEYRKPNDQGNSIRHEENLMLLLISIEQDALKIKMTGCDLGYPRKMFKTKFKYHQLPEKIRKHVKNLEEFF